MAETSLSLGADSSKETGTVVLQTKEMARQTQDKAFGTPRKKWTFSISLIILMANDSGGQI